MQSRQPLASGVRAVTALVLVAVVCAAPAPTTAAAPAANAARSESTPAKSDERAGRLVFLLEYVGTDYENAVRDGNVVDQAEYGEVLRMLKQLASEYAARPDRTVPVADGIVALQRHV